MPLNPQILSPSGRPSGRRAVCLLAVFALVKVGLVAARVVEGRGQGLLSVWTVPLLVYQDVWVALGYLGIDRALGRRTPVLLWSLYGLLVAYAAVNFPIARTLSTPLTYQLASGVGGALLDSLLLYLTPANLLSLAAVTGAALLLPRLIGPTWSPSRRWWLVGAVVAGAVVVAGPIGARRVETLGLHRNAALTLVTTSLRPRAVRRADPPSPRPDWAEAGPARDLSSLAGGAAGRNVLWVSLESTPAGALRLHGAPRDPMPALEKLAEHALVFDAAYAAYPGSMKALFALLCAEEPTPHSAPKDYGAAARPCASVAAELGRAGYRTALFHSGRLSYLGMRDIVAERGFETVWDADRAAAGTAQVRFGVDEETTVAQLLAFVDSLRPDERFFILYVPIAGHHPYDWPGAARPFGVATAEDRHANDLRRGDQALGHLLDGLAARHLAERTLYVLHGDHGEAFFQHDGNFAHPMFLYDENVRVPLIIAAPGLVEQQQRVPQPAGQIDFAPTVAALLGRPAAARWTGRSLLTPGPRLARFFTDYGLPQAGLRDGRWKFIRQLETGRGHLFDVATDPAERHDRTTDEPERSRRYREHLEAWLGE